MLHIVKTQQAIHSALPYMANGDDILLIEDAVYLANPKHAQNSLLPSVSVSVLRADIDARGLGDHISAQITCVGYSGFVSLTERHQQSLTWE